MAFSLVELSIVLVILGLLTGGILAGKSLIRASEIRSIATDFNRYSTAVNTFRDKYLGFPGDLTNAASFWGIAAGTAGNDATCRDGMSANSQATCNGDGNGQLAWPSITYEVFTFWQHLANAGLIEGRYSGLAGPLGTADVVIGTNAPASRIAGAGYAVNFLKAYGVTGYPASTTHYAGNYFSNVMSFGTDTAANLYWPWYPAIRPEEAWNIDTKIDDGSPVNGRIFTFKSTSPLTPGCTTADDNTALYSLSNPDIACMLYYSLGNSVHLG